MRPMLDDLELPNVQELISRDLRRLAEHKIPGMAGSLLQNMGRTPTGVVLWGISAGGDAIEFVETLNEKFRAGEPFPFVGDIIADAEIGLMIIDDLRWEEIAGKPDRFAYILTLREYIEPIEPADQSFIDLEVLDEVSGLMEDLIDAIDLLPFFDTGLEQFVEPMSGFLSDLQSFSDS